MEICCLCAGGKDRKGIFMEALVFQHVYKAIFLMNQRKWGACLTPTSDIRIGSILSSPSAPTSHYASISLAPIAGEIVTPSSAAGLPTEDCDCRHASGPNREVTAAQGNGEGLSFC